MEREDGGEEAMSDIVGRGMAGGELMRRRAKGKMGG